MGISVMGRRIIKCRLSKKQWLMLNEEWLQDYSVDFEHFADFS